MNHMTYQQDPFAPWNEPQEPGYYEEITCECGEEIPSSEAWIFSDSRHETIACNDCKAYYLKIGYKPNQFKRYE